MSTITVNTCDCCNMPLANKLVVTVRGMKLCSLPCGRIMVGEAEYMKAWNDKAKEINRRNNRHKHQTLRLVNE